MYIHINVVVFTALLQYYARTPILFISLDQDVCIMKLPISHRQEMSFNQLMP